MADHPFPWREEEFVTGRGRVLRPTVDVTLRSAELQITSKALLDTGSPRCVFPRGLGDLLSIEFPSLGSDCDKTISLMGKIWPAQTCFVTMLLQPFQESWEAEVDFVQEEGLAFGLLGYEGFFNRWAVSFNGYLGYFIVSPVQEFHDRQSSEILARLQEM